jgi:nucleotide-binding universal stress UspA family protein
MARANRSNDLRERKCSEDALARSPSIRNFCAGLAHPRKGCADDAASRLMIAGPTLAPSSSRRSQDRHSSSEIMPSKFTHILVPTDFGEPAEHALDLAIELARTFDAKLSVLHVYQVLLPMPYGDGLASPFEQIAARARGALDEHAAKTKARYPEAEAVFRSGTIWQEVASTANDLGVDLIVMGTHGRHGLSRAMLGSVAERVVRLAQVPVLTVRGPSETEALSRTP